MAQIVLGIGTSHGPMLAIDPELWVERADGEMASEEPVFNKLDGTFVSYAELEADVGKRFAEKATPTKVSEFVRSGMLLVRILGINA